MRNMRTALSLTAAIATVLLLTPATATAATEETDVDIQLAQLTYTSGLVVDLTDSRPSNDIGLVQTGLIGRAALIARDRDDSYLETYLKITPRSVAVPQRLIEDHGPDLPEELRLRVITTSPVVVDGLTAPSSATITGAAACNFTWYGWTMWHDTGVPGLAPKSYTTYDFGGYKERYADSYVANCTPPGSPSYLYAQHRIYYRLAGNWVKHFDSKVAPWHHQAAWKGTVKNHRKVVYNDGWDSSPNCGGGTCVYTREGRFTS
ncbi:hypothetical protein OIE66_06650 [Nonomuraea sp. NBC_01738]|uniref:hypothetical protein n=1 Tax=Nonomuraea sp. NBC_01738 TaxID=2976003 RepID=UPI002E10E410|nr:hypothetical protein OIE66_06650 [Nonomuraea sp. NBC_01738]